MNAGLLGSRAVTVAGRLQVLEKIRPAINADVNFYCTTSLPKNTEVKLRNVFPLNNLILVNIFDFACVLFSGNGTSYARIGHFWITLGLFFKVSLGARPFICKSIFIHTQIKLIFMWAPGLALKNRPELIQKCMAYYHGCLTSQVKSSLFKQGDPFSTWLVSIGALRRSAVVKSCETGPPVLSSLSEKTGKSNHL